MFRKIQFKSFKLLLTYMFLLICSVSVLGFYSFQNSIQSIEQRTQLDLHRSLQLIKEDVNYKMKEIEGVSDIIYFDQDFQYYTRVPDEGGAITKSRRNTLSQA
jgi:two-component system sensor histidine kinase YesM